MTDPTVTTTTLANGFPVTTVELPHLHTVDVALFVRVGSRFETPEQNGLSHFVEHMLFRGAGPFENVVDIHNYAAVMGSSVHAETGRDCTVYRMRVLPEYVGGAIRLLSEMMTKPHFHDIDTERKLVLEEIAGDSEDGASDLAMGALLKDHPLGQPIIGTAKNVRGFTLADVRRHHRRYYTARNATLCVAGPVPHVDVVREASAQTIRWNWAGRIEEFEPIPVRRSGAARVVHRRDADAQIEMAFAIRGVGLSDRRFVAQSALVRAWDASLHAQLADERGLAYSVSAITDPFIDTSVILVEVECAAEKMDELVRVLVEEFLYPRRLADNAQRLKVRAQTEAMGLLDDPESMTEWFGGLSLYMQPPTIDQRLLAIEGVTQNQMHGVASDIVRSERMAMAWIGALPKKVQAAMRKRLAIK